MCIMCIEIEKERLTYNEAFHNWGEIRTTVPAEHAREVDKKLKELREREEQKAWSSVVFRKTV